MGNKKKKTFTQLVAVALSHFSNANFEKLNLSVGKLPEYCNTWKCYILF